MGTNRSWGMRLVMAAILATASTGAGCKSGGGAGGVGGDGGAGGMAGTGGTGGTGGIPDVVDISDSEQLGALVEQQLPLVAEIQSVTVESPPTVEFTVRTQGGVGVVGIPEGAVGGTFSKLVPPAASPPAANPTSSRWVSYINQVVPGAGANPALPEALQPTVEQGPLVDNGDGSYRFTYTTDVTAVTDPVPIAWDPDNTTRAGLEIRIESLINPDNPHFDFVPSGGPGTGSKDISATALCNDCHQRLSMHESGRFASEYCVTCHNGGHRDPDTGEPLSMAYMVHSIHASRMRALAGTPYVVIGPTGEATDHSRVTYPQDLRECESCHNGSDAPDGDAWTTEVSALACGGCHAGGFVELSTEETTGIGSYSIQHVISNSIVEPDDAECRGCHNNPTAFPDLVTAERHVIPERIAAEEFEYNILDVTDTNVGQTPSITFSVTNPKDGSAYDLGAVGGPFDTNTWGDAARLEVMLAWPSNEYSNIDTGSEVPGSRPGAPAQNVSIDPLGGNCPGATCIDNDDGSYTITSPVEVPAGLTGDSLAVAIEGHPAVELYPNLECSGGANAGNACADGADCPDATCMDTGEAERIPVAGAVAYYAVSETGGAGEERVLGVSLEKCASCHGSLLSEHGSSNSIAVCVTCHNANATDIRGRAEAGAAGEQSIDFTTMIHAIHAAEIRDLGNPYVVYGSGGRRNDYSAVTYPGRLDNCGACHVGDSYYPIDPSETVRFATTYISDNFDGADLVENVTPTPPFTPLRTLTLANQEDDLNQTTNAAACLQCHVSPTTESHTIVPGGAKLFVKQDDDTTLLPPAGDPAPRQVETCVFCHGPGSSVCERCDIGPGHMPWFPLD